MKKILLYVFLIICIFEKAAAFAARTDSQYFVASCPETNSVIANGGNISANIDPETGTLSTSFTPAFRITTNNRNTKYLTFSATANTNTTTQNAIFNIGSTKYIILTNNTVLPAISSLTDIKSGSPSEVNNPNAIAYQINDPATATGLSVNYNATNKNWDLTLNRRGQTNTSITVPANTPLANTYSADDEAGSYRATVTLSFN